MAYDVIISPIVEGLPLGGGGVLPSRVRYRSTAAPFGAALENSRLSTAASGPVTHTVQTGETLTGIVRDALKRGGGAVSPAAVSEAVRRVAAANGLSNPDRIYPGQRLNLSGVSSGEGKVSGLAGPVSVSVPPMAAVGQPLRSRARYATPVLEGAAYRGGSRFQRAETLGGQGGPLRPAFRASRVGSILDDAAALRRAARDLSELADRLLEPAAGSCAVAGACAAPWAHTLPGGRLTSGYGLRKDPVTGVAETHEGIDLAAKHGAPILAYADGVVRFSGWQAGYGRIVVVQHADGTESAYAHNSRNLVKAGERVAKGTVLAEVGSSGRSTGPHLHFEIRKEGRAVDPMPYLAAAGMPSVLQLARGQ